MDRFFVYLQHLIPQHGLSRLTGRLANCRLAWIKNPFIFLFARLFKVDLGEARIQDCRQFQHFNDFFTRELLAGSRPLAGDARTLVSPADGIISQLGPIREQSLLQAKGIEYSAEALLGGDEQDFRLFKNGSFLTIYLSPRDYHRVHMPIAGKLLRTVYIPGKLLSVNRQTTRLVPDLFTRNERLVCLFDTEAGPMAMVLVGAMIVAGIQTVWGGKACPSDHGLKRQNYNRLTSQVRLERGAEMGRFMLGSTVILLFGPNAVTLSASLAEGSPIRLGEAIANRPSPES
ncbi:MAG: archaetidylserine decarboxylase [Gammaproteobacteria bacterium]